MSGSLKLGNASKYFVLSILLCFSLSTYGDDSLDNTFLEAIKQKDFELAQSLIELGADKKKAGRYVYIYVQDSDMQSLAYLLDTLEVDPNMFDYSTEVSVRFCGIYKRGGSCRSYKAFFPKTGLVAAINKRDEEEALKYVKYMAGKGANLRRSNKSKKNYRKYSINIFHIAVLSKNLKVVEYFIRNNSDINALFTVDFDPGSNAKRLELTPLAIADSTKDSTRWAELVLLLLSNGADPNINKYLVNSSVGRCVEKNQEDNVISVIDKMIEKGANANIKTVKKATKLGCRKLAKYLLPKVKASAD